MGKQTAERETVKDMEHLVKLLHKEWGRSGRTKAEITIPPGHAAEVKAQIAAAIAERQKQLEADEMDFKQGMALSRENFILLRLAKKMKKAQERADKKWIELKFGMELDKEEYRLFKEITGTQEG